MKKLNLIGSGLAGGLLAAFLGRRGYEVELFERRADPRAENFVGGRSINLALSTRGIHALKQLGIAGRSPERRHPDEGADDSRYRRRPTFCALRPRPGEAY